MKKITLLAVVFIFCIVVMGPAGFNHANAADPAADPPAPNTPKAVVVGTVAFTFEEVLEGEDVTHAYVIENQGSAPLAILDVKTSCGCTTAQRPQSIAPGTQDRIVVKANTNGYGGTLFNKSITVTTNDPVHPKILFLLKGQVASFARIEPRSIALNGETTETLQAEALITANPKYPFRIVQALPDQGLDGKVEVSMEQRGKAYHIVIRNLLTTPGKYRGTIIFKTDSPIRPELSLYVYGRLVAKHS